MVEVNVNKRLATFKVWSIKLTLNGGKNKCDLCEGVIEMNVIKTYTDPICWKLQEAGREKKTSVNEYMLFSWFE